MPEISEIVILSQYLFTKLQNRMLERMEIISGKYTHQKISNSDLLDGKTMYTIKNIDSKGKLLWMILEDVNTQNVVYLTSNLGLTGFWGFSENKNNRLRFVIHNEDQTKQYFLYYDDPRNFGNIRIYSDVKEFQARVNELAPDALKEDFNEKDFLEWYDDFLNKTKKRKDMNIALVLMKQKSSDGIISGIGNYLMAEILYRSKISPHRTVGSLSDIEIKALANSILYLTKLSYYNNTTGYMTHFDGFIEIHKERVDKGIYPNYHPNVKLKKTDHFEFKVYRRDFDPLGNEVIADRTIQKNRTTYWVPNVQT